jgi:hypothetical protein
MVDSTRRTPLKTGAAATVIAAVPAHPYVVAMEAAMLAPNADVSMFPWKEPKERIPLAIRQIRSFLHAHRPAITGRSIWPSS